VIAGRIKADPRLVTTPRLLADGAVRSVLEKYLGLDPEQPGWMALSTTALLTRVGWTKELQGESESLFRANGLDPSEARRAVERLHAKYGIAPLGGRFRYVRDERLRSWTTVRLSWT
jgi:hypothetical protein